MFLLSLSVFKMVFSRLLDVLATVSTSLCFKVIISFVGIISYDSAYMFATDKMNKTH